MVSALKFSPGAARSGSRTQFLPSYLQPVMVAGANATLALVVCFVTSACAGPSPNSKYERVGTVFFAVPLSVCRFHSTWYGATLLGSLLQPGSSMSYV